MEARINRGLVKLCLAEKRDNKTYSGLTLLQAPKNNTYDRRERKSVGMAKP